MSTLTTEQSRNAVYNFTSEKLRIDFFAQAKKVQERLEKDKEYKRMVLELETYVHKFYMKDKPYRNMLYQLAVSSMRVCIRMFKANPPKDYENTIDFAKKVLNCKEVINTENKLATLINFVCNKFEITKVSKTQKIEKYTTAEIRYFVVGIQSGYMDRDEVREMIKKGKVVKKK